MPECLVCVHPQRGEIEAALLKGAGQRAIARQYDVGRGSVQRHATKHLGLATAKASELVQPAVVQAVQEELTHAARAAAAFTESLEHVRSVIQGYMARAVDSDGRYQVPLEHEETKTLLAAVRTLHSHMQVWARVQEVMHAQAGHDITKAPAWLRFRAALARALAPYPEARAAVAAALRELEDD